MHKKKKLLIALNLVGGPAVLGSYVHGILTHPGSAEALWGELPQAARIPYTGNMFLAAAGYLFFTYHLLFKVDAEEARAFGGRLGYGALLWAYTAILLGSTLWMPLSFAAVDRAEAALFGPIVGVLWMTALGSLTLLGALATLEPVAQRSRLAVVGAAFFCLQTVLLDASIWPWFFRIGG